MRVIIPNATPTSGTFARSTTATYVAEDGVLMYSGGNQPRYQDGLLMLEAAGSNELTYSEALDNAAWVKVRTTITANATAAPDGATTADKVVEDTATGAHHCNRSVSFTGGVTYTLSAFFKAEERTKGNIRLGNGAVGFNGGIADCAFDLLAETAIKGGFGLSAGITALAGGWFRVWITGTADSTGSDNAAVLFLSNGTTGTYTGDGVSGMYVWGAQLEVGAAPSSYIPRTGAGAATRGADALTGQYLVSVASTPVGLPIQVTAEDSAAAWVSGTTYAVDALVHRPSNHRVYLRKVAGAGTTPPEDDPINWRDVRSTTRWTPLVATENTKLLQIGNTYLTVVPVSNVTALYVGGLTAASVRVVVVSPAGAVLFDQSYTMPLGYLDGLPSNEPGLFVDLSAGFVSGSSIHVSIIGAGSGALNVSGIRYLMLGRSHDLGGMLQGPRLGITDYSRKETDEFGTTTFVRRGYAKRLNVDLLVQTSDLERLFAILADLRALPALWVPSEVGQLAPLTLYGWCKDFGITVAYTDRSLCAIEIEGLA